MNGCLILLNIYKYKPLYFLVIRDLGGTNFFEILIWVWVNTHFGCVKVKGCLAQQRWTGTKAEYLFGSTNVQLWALVITVLEWFTTGEQVLPTGAVGECCTSLRRLMTEFDLCFQKLIGFRLHRSAPSSLELPVRIRNCIPHAI